MKTVAPKTEAKIPDMLKQLSLFPINDKKSYNGQRDGKNTQCEKTSHNKMER